MDERIILVETERLYIRQLTDKDFNLMSLIWTEAWPPLIANNKTMLDSLLQNFWKGTQDPAVLTGLIFLRDGDTFCGRVNIQNTNQEIPETGIDLLRDYQNRGYGPEAITAFLNWYGAYCHISQIKVRISFANTRSTHVFAKLGAKLNGEISMFPDLVQNIRKNLPGGKANTIEDLKVREYILKLPVQQEQAKGAS